MEDYCRHQNAYSCYDELYSTIENFKERVQYISHYPCFASNSAADDEDGSDREYEDALDELWEMIEFMLTDETFNELFSEDVYDFIGRALEEEGLSLRHDFHRVLDDRDRGWF